MLDWADDGGNDFGHEHWRSMGKVGEFKKRAIWNKLGKSRNRVYRVVITDPVEVKIINAHLEAQAGAS
jgi:hypothetical protein